MPWAVTNVVVLTNTASESLCGNGYWEEKVELIVEETAYAKRNASYDTDAKQLLSEIGLDSLTCAADAVCLFGKKAIRINNSPVSRVSNTTIIKSVPTQSELQTDTKALTGNNIQETASVLPPGWIEKYDVKEGRVYVNITTGCSTTIKPDHEVAAERKRGRDVAMKNDDFLASWKFLPKKRLLKAAIKCTDSVCSISKPKINDDLPKVFYSDNKQKNPFPDRPLIKTCCKISKLHLQNVTVVGQVSNEFIICVIHDLESQHSSIVVFDQHAVHERIRLEQLIKGVLCGEAKNFGIKSKKLTELLKVQVNAEQLQIMGSYENCFNKAGLYYQLPLNHASNNISISAVPTIFAENENLKQNVQQLIEDRTKALLNKQVSSSIPPSIFNLLCSRACHGAIRFGDPLSVNQSSNLIKDLAQCQLPFQCAHGRPSLFPLIELNSGCFCPEPAPCNFARLKKMMTSPHSIS